MKTRLGLISWATGTLLLVAVTSCSEPGEGPSPAPPTSSSPSEPSTSASPKSESEIASESATAVINRYYAVLDEVRQDPRVPISKLRRVETSLLLDADTRLVKAERKKGHRQIGTILLSDVTVQSVNLDNSDPAAGKMPTVVIDVCWDVSGVDLVDRKGRSLVRPSRPDQGLTRYFVANYHFKDDPAHGWRVASGEDLKLASCVTS